MKKQLIIKNEVVEMTFEEVLEQFTPAIHKEINDQKSQVANGTEEREDMFQDASVELWKAYQKYDIEQGLHFFTYAQKYIRGGVFWMGKRNNRKKRKCITVSMDEQLSEGEEDFTLKNSLSENLDMSSSMETKEILKTAIQQMTNTEAEYLVYMLKEYSSAEVAREKGITRQGTAAIYRQIRKKVKAVAENY